MGRFGLIGGSGLLKSRHFQELQEIQVCAPGYNKVRMLKGLSFYFCQRHHAGESGDYAQPHNIDTASICAAFGHLGVKTVIGFCSVGSLREDIEPGTVAVCDDYWNLFNPRSGFTDQRAHIEPGFSEAVRSALVDILSAHSDAFPKTITKDVVYAQTKGPRFETRAEITFLGTVGHVVGMTGAHEATMMKEREIEYAAYSMVDNYANGISNKSIDYEIFKGLVAQNLSSLETLVDLVVQRFSAATVEN